METKNYLGQRGKAKPAPPDVREEGAQSLMKTDSGQYVVVRRKSNKRPLIVPEKAQKPKQNVGSTRNSSDQ